MSRDDDATPPTNQSEGFRMCQKCGRTSDVDLYFCPYCGKVFDEPMPAPMEPIAKQTAPVPPAQPAYQGEYQRPPEPQWSRPPEVPYNRPSTSSYDSWTKDQSRAFKIGLGLGFLGFMGMGHLYMGKKVRGILLFLIGGFLATLSLTAWLTVWDSGHSLVAMLVTAVVFSVPFLALQVWQAFDAPKPPKGFNDPYKNVPRQRY